MGIVLSRSEETPNISHVRKLRNNEILSQTGKEIFCLLFNRWETTPIYLEFYLDFMYGDLLITAILSKSDLHTSEKVMSSTTVYNRVLVAYESTSNNTSGVNSYSTSITLCPPPLSLISDGGNYRLDIYARNPGYQNQTTTMLYSTSYITMSKS